jgi:gas vesicle protein
MNNTSKIVLGLAVAAAAGAAIGMLLAPEKGTDLQKKIKDGANDWLTEFTALLTLGSQAVSHFKSKSEQKLISMKEELSKLAELNEQLH